MIIDPDNLTHRPLPPDFLLLPTLKTSMFLSLSDKHNALHQRKVRPLCPYISVSHASKQCPPRPGIARYTTKATPSSLSLSSAENWFMDLVLLTENNRTDTIKEAGRLYCPLRGYTRKHHRQKKPFTARGVQIPTVASRHHELILPQTKLFVSPPQRTSIRVSKGGSRVSYVQKITHATNNCDISPHASATKYESPVLFRIRVLRMDHAIQIQ